MKEFMHKFGIPALLREKFKTTDRSFARKHKDADNLLQIICQILGAYFTDDTADFREDYFSCIDKSIYCVVFFIHLKNVYWMCCYGYHRKATAI